jgi:eukaryotic-like serine/threonine-protein kinase
VQTDRTITGSAANTWTVLSGQLEEFVQAWESGPAPPQLSEFLTGVEPSARRLTLIELVKVDLEYRWRNQMARLLEEYFREFPELSETPPVDLIYEEYHVRMQAGDRVEPQEYRRRFPDCARELERMLDFQAADVSTSLGGMIRPTAALAEVEPGQKLDDFDLLTSLGTGAFARVFLARQNSMQRLVALKISADRSQEPQTLAQLDHDHIVRVFDQRLLPERGLRLLYMQYVAGGTLQAVVETVRRTPAAERTGRLLLETIDDSLLQRGESRPADSPLRERLADAPWPEVVCWLGARLARALDYAHRQGVLHRDLKPANVLVTADGSPKLADFNVSFSSQTTGATPVAYFGGSLAYMSPEQLEAANPAHERTPESLDGRSDLYSLGILLWELLTGHRPFADPQVDGNWPATLSKMVAARQQGIDDASLAAASRHWPHTLGPIVRHSLEVDPARRIASGAELARSLELCLQPSAQRLLAPPVHDWRRWARRFPTLLVVIAAIFPNAVAAVVNYFYNRTEIVDHLDHAQEVFWATKLMIDSIVFPLGAFLIVRACRPLARALAEPARVAELPPETQWVLKRRCLRFGRFASWYSMGLWLLAAPTYPIVIELVVGSEPLSDWVHFIISVMFSGLIAGAYPFLGVTFLTVCSFYPAIIRIDTLTRRDHDALVWLGRASWFYLLLAASVPMLSVAILVATGSHAKWTLVTLASGGTVGLATAVLLFRTIQSDLAALVDLATPQGDLESSSTGSFSHKLK